MQRGLVAPRFAWKPSAASYSHSHARAVGWPLIIQAGIPLAIILVELFALRTWLVRSGGQSNLLAALLSQRGPGTFRFAVVQFTVAFAMVLLMFGELRLAHLRVAFGKLEPRGVVRSALMAHAAFVLVCASLLATFFDVPLTLGWAGVLTFGWFAAAFAALWFAAVAFVPAPFWVLAFRAVRQTLAFAAIVAAGAFAFGRLAATTWEPLSRATTAVVYSLLHAIVPGVTVDPAAMTLGNSAFRVEIHAQCSGYEGLGLMFVFTAASLWFHRKEWRFPQALVLVPVGLSAIWILNCVRVALLILIGVAGAPDVAVNGFHSQAGWVAFNLVALGTCLGASRTPWLLRRHAEQTSSRVANPTVPYLLPFLAILAGAMTAQLVSAGFEWLYAIRVIFAAGALCCFLPRYRALDWRMGWAGIAMGVAAFLVWSAMERLTGSVMSAGMPAALAGASAMRQNFWIAFRAFGAVITVPIAEELAFRGFLLKRFESEDFESVGWHSIGWAAIILSSAAFGALHGGRWLAGILVGILYALTYLRRGSLGDAIAAHATTNALIAAEVLVLGHWQLW